jgi:hypothetical protein
VKYKAEIKKMIDARRAVGIHSESKVTEEAKSGYYRATVYGTRGQLKLMLGTAAADEQPAGYTEVIKGTDYALYFSDQPETEGVEQTDAAQPAPDRTQPMYNVTGQRVRADYRGVIIQNGHKYINQ